MKKYRNKPHGGYESRKEMTRAFELKMLNRVGTISELEEQPKFELIPKQEGERAVTYTADFSYMQNGQRIVEDVKSPATRKLPAYVIKRKLMLHVHGIRVVEV